MKTLAARMAMPELAKKAITVAAVAVPMVLVECGDAFRDGVRPSAPVTVVEVPAIKDQSRGDDAELKRMKPGEAPEKAETVLNANIYPGCVIEARLSVVNRDDSLNRVILDPSVDFFAEIQPETGVRMKVVGESRMRVCHKVAECDMTEYVRTWLPLRHNLQSDREVIVRVNFIPAGDSGFAPSETTLRVMPEELVSYCP